jgi:hypothetical protein
MSASRSILTPACISTRRTLPATQGAGSNYKNPRLEPPDHGFGRSRGGLSTKIHHLIDGHGLPLVIAVAAGQANDAPALLPLLAQLRVGRDSLSWPWPDGSIWPHRGSASSVL